MYTDHPWQGYSLLLPLPPLPHVIYSTVVPYQEMMNLFYSAPRGARDHLDVSRVRLPNLTVGEIPKILSIILFPYSNMSVLLFSQDQQLFPSKFPLFSIKS